MLCHRDYHSRNLMRHAERLYWIDFQDARMGPATYDLASLLRDAYVDVPEELQDELKERFRQKAAPDEPREVFRRRFDLMCVQRNLKALGTFGYMATVRQQPGLPAVHPAHPGPRAAQPVALPGARAALADALAPRPGARLTRDDTMKTARIEEFGSHVGEEVLVRGWIHNKRSSGKLQFLIVRDGLGLRAGGGVEEGGAARGVGRRSRRRGRSRRSSSRARCGTTSARPAATRSTCARPRCCRPVHDYPITPKDHGTAFLMEHRHLWLRSARQHAIARVRHTVVKAVRDYLDDQGFILADTPIFTPAACEGTTTLFGVPYFDEGTAYLTQSGQLYNEATAAAHGKVYCFGPTFRAEKSKTRRHLTEFWMVEPEIAFAHLDDAMALAEGLVCSRGRAGAREAQGGAEGPRARHREAREREGRPSRACTTRTR